MVAVVVVLWVGYGNGYWGGYILWLSALLLLPIPLRQLTPPHPANTSLAASAPTSPLKDIKHSAAVNNWWNPTETVHGGGISGPIDDPFGRGVEEFGGTDLKW